MLSKTDRDRHYINARTLAHLYGVKYEDCEVSHDDSMGFYRGKWSGGQVYLYPDSSGTYKLPA